MKLRIKGYPHPVIFYGYEAPIQGLCDQLLAMGFQPDCLIYPGEEPAYQGIPRQAEAILADIPPENLRLVLLPGGDWGGYRTLRTELLEINRALADCCYRDIEFLSELLTYGEILDPPVVQKPAQPYTLMGMNLGFVMGGVETWVGETYHELRQAGAHVKVLEPLQASPYSYVGPGFYGVDEGDVRKIGPYEGFLDYVLPTVELLCQDPPRIFIDNGSFRTMAAVFLAKKCLGLDIRVILVLHGDIGLFYNRLKYFQEGVDQIIAVSEDICKHAVDMLPHRAGDAKVKLRLPTPQRASLEAKLPSETLHIAYAARLEARNKRSLWLKDVAAGLASRNVAFALHIAGDGDCLEELRSFAKEQGLEDRMLLYGRVDHSKMNDFYGDKHVFVNFSISEGGPLTLFESMSHGLVPVVTDAGSAKRLISPGESGFIIEDPQQVVDRLCELAADPAKTARMGAAALEALEAFATAQGSFIADFL